MIGVRVGAPTALSASVEAALGEGNPLSISAPGSALFLASTQPETLSSDIQFTDTEDVGGTGTYTIDFAITGADGTATPVWTCPPGPFAALTLNSGANGSAAFNVTGTIAQLNAAFVAPPFSGWVDTAWRTLTVSGVRDVGSVPFVDKVIILQSFDALTAAAVAENVATGTTIEDFGAAAGSIHPSVVAAITSSTVYSRPTVTGLSIIDNADGTVNIAGTASAVGDLYISLDTVTAAPVGGASTQTEIDRIVAGQDLAGNAADGTGETFPVNSTGAFDFDTVTSVGAGADTYTYNVVLRADATDGTDNLDSRVYNGTVAVTIADVAVPTISSSTPADNATDVAIDATITITFNENIQFITSAGTFTLRDNDGGFADLEVFTPSTTSAATGAGGGSASISGAVLTITPGADFANSIEHALRFASNVIEDTAGNDFAGIANDTTLSWTSVATAGVSAITLEASAGTSGSGTSRSGPSGITAAAGDKTVVIVVARDAAVDITGVSFSTAGAALAVSGALGNYQRRQEWFEIDGALSSESVTVTFASTPTTQCWVYVIKVADGNGMTVQNVSVWDSSVDGTPAVVAPTNTVDTEFALVCSFEVSYTSLTTPPSEASVLRASAEIDPPQAVSFLGHNIGQITGDGDYDFVWAGNPYGTIIGVTWE